MKQWKKLGKLFFRSLIEAFRPFPKKVKFLTALKWWLEASYFTYDKGNFWGESKRKYRRYCSECGWPLIRIDDLYDVPIEAIHPNAIQICQLCGIEYEVVEGEFFSRPGKYKAILPIWK